MVNGEIDITDIVKHKLYRASLMDKSEVKKWMERGVYDPASGLAS